ncbi:5-oxoprolinase subunit B family protein [Nocardioides sp. Leaf374]|uniref:5-oxoprolinase subunit B family protein n=1 Tax=Nocardioides sp. Leaf374 TaxID=2876560 RepID=UPI001E61D5FF|nr:carboxyltransferase domain-containing protein [Nocardioides sp. Leaf374]
MLGDPGSDLVGARRVLPYGAHALLVEVGGAGAAAALASWLRALRLPVADVVPAAATVLVDGLADAAAHAAVRDAVARWRPTGRATDGPLVVLEVDYDGEDLADVAALWGCSVQEAVARHSALELTAAFCGFAPGFSYLVGLPAELAVPRLATPRTRVPAGSVALADRWCGVYPTASPGGWRLIGRTDAVLWDPDRLDPGPALLAPGTRVRFVAR